MKKYAIAFIMLIVSAFFIGYLHAQHDNYQDLQAKYERGLKDKEKMLLDNERLRKELEQKRQAVTSNSLQDRNRNSTNVKVSLNGQKWKGQIATDNRKHVVFENQDYAIRATALTLRTYYIDHKLDNLESIVNRFCTATPAGKKAYVSFLSKRLKIGAKEKFNVLSRMSELLAGIARYESGKELPKHIVAHYDILEKL